MRGEQAVRFDLLGSERIAMAASRVTEHFDISGGPDEGPTEARNEEVIQLCDAPTHRSEVREMTVQVRTLVSGGGPVKVSPVRSSFEGPRRWRAHRVSTEDLELVSAPPGLDPSMRESKSLEHPCADFAEAVLKGNLDPVDLSLTVVDNPTSKEPSAVETPGLKSSESVSVG